MCPLIFHIICDYHAEARAHVLLIDSGIGTQHLAAYLNCPQSEAGMGCHRFAAQAEEKWKGYYDTGVLIILARLFCIPPLS